MDVVFCDIDEAAVRTTKAEIETSRSNVVAEVPMPSMRRNFAESTFGHIDIVVNVVGGVLMQPFMDKSHESCDQLSREPTHRRLPPVDRRGKEPHDGAVGG